MWATKLNAIKTFTIWFAAGTVRGSATKSTGQDLERAAPAEALYNAQLVYKFILH